MKIHGDNEFYTFEEVSRLALLEKVYLSRLKGSGEIGIAIPNGLEFIRINFGYGTIQPLAKMQDLFKCEGFIDHKEIIKSLENEGRDFNTTNSNLSNLFDAGLIWSFEIAKASNKYRNHIYEGVIYPGAFYNKARIICAGNYVGENQ